MKGILSLVFVLLIRSLAFSSSADLDDYIKVIAGFTENKQNLEAVKLCDRLISSNPEAPDLYFLRGINRYFLEDYEGAVQDFDKTLELDPNYPDVYLYRAKAKKAGKNYFGAMRDYSKAKDRNFSQTVTSLAGDMFRSLFSERKD